MLGLWWKSFVASAHGGYDCCVRVHSGSGCLFLHADIVGMAPEQGYIVVVQVVGLVHTVT